MGKMVLKAGTKRAIHVYTKVLVERMKEDKGQMLWLVRSSLHDYKKAIICRRVEWNGPCSGEDLFGKALPGTGGRGVAILFTEAELTLHFDGDKAEIIDMDDDAKPAEKKPEPPPVVVKVEKPDPRPVRPGVRIINRRTLQPVG
jgi:hypothetical protein